MSTRTAFTLFIGLMATCVHAMDRATADSLVVRAADAYDQGDHAIALALFDSVAGAWDSGALQFNIGNCHYKLGDVPRAILHYERALRRAPGAEDVRANLDLARQQVVDRVNELPGFSLGATWGRLRGGRDTDTWARRALLACLLCCGMFAMAMSLRHRVARRVAYAVAGLLLIGTIATAAMAASRAAEVRNNSEAIILSPKVDIRSEPREDGTVLFVLHKGTKVSVLHERGTWSEVRLPNGNVGWMPSATMAKI